MSRYYAPIRGIIENPVSIYLTDRYFFDCVLENNEKATAWKDSIRDCIVVECDNKPRDLLVFGVRWQEDKDG